VSKWSLFPISDIASIVLGGTPSRNNPDYWTGDIPWATAKDITSTVGRYIYKTEESITQLGLEESAAKLLPKGTIVITARGTVGAVAQLGTEMAFNQTCYGLLAKPQVDQDYLFYAIKGSLYEMQSLTYGTVFATITMASFDHWKIPIPPLSEQRAIAHILGTLDDKIELNRHMNETLEAMARAIFKAWFVDFEPVRAKMEGRWKRGQSLPGLPAHLYDLFPDRLVPSELGEIPEGWRVGRISDLCDRIENGGTPRRMEPRYWGGSIPWFKTGELIDGPLLASDETITEEGLSNSSCKLWPIGTILVALYASPTVGRLGILEVPAAANQACSALFTKPEYGNLFVFYSLLATRGRLQQIAVGAAQQNINQGIVRDHKVIVPPPAIAQTFQASVGTLYQRRVGLFRESRTLAALRDALLPKLIRGEIRVRDAERFLEEKSAC
jgi:type I restriction enzyme S subunit